MPDQTPRPGEKPGAAPDPAQEAFEQCTRLVLAGRYEEALAATDEAARLLRGRLAGARGAAARGAAATLAYVLVLRCEALSKLARWEECLATASEAVALGRGRQTDAPFAAPLGATLLGLGTALWGLGRPQEAVTVTGEAVGLYRRLSRADAAYRPQLANALSQFGVVLSRLGRYAEALKVTRESVVLMRRLAAADPVAHTPGLAQAVNNLARRQSARNQHPGRSGAPTRPWRSTGGWRRRTRRCTGGTSRWGSATWPGCTTPGRGRWPRWRSRSPSSRSWTGPNPAPTAHCSQIRCPCSRRRWQTWGGSARRPGSPPGRWR
ncbi:hypothetical protein ACFYUY_21360 [Kitasatospora sp. NPDC004745]|uniref:tetratricopeptide repeat protein n=1 Tax=Kitasatospora sp. NPDC004745 TaxID=3364019 RepID=UPI0036CEAF1E